MVTMVMVVMRPTWWLGRGRCTRRSCRMTRCHRRRTPTPATSPAAAAAPATALFLSMSLPPPRPEPLQAWRRLTSPRRKRLSGSIVPVGAWVLGHPARRRRRELLVPMVAMLVLVLLLLVPVPVPMMVTALYPRASGSLL